MKKPAPRRSRPPSGRPSPDAGKPRTRAAGAPKREPEPRRERAPKQESKPRRDGSSGREGGFKRADGSRRDGASKREGFASRDGAGRPPRRTAAPSTTTHHEGKRRPTSFNPKKLKQDLLKDKGHIWTPGPNALTIKSEAGTDLAHFVVSRANGRLSVRKAREALEAGCCRINGRIETYGSYKLQRNDIVELLLPEEDPEHVFDERRILHNDRGVLAYDKPPHLAVTPQDGPKSWSLFDILKAALPDQPLFPVHRLDADTSGIVLFAKDQTTATRLEAMFKDHAVEKTYQAIVRGQPREEGLHRSYLVKVAAGKGFERWKSGRGDDAREAVTAWKVEERLGKYGSLVTVHPRTGRYHQIRIHFSELGHPLYGDRQYGDRLDPVHVHRHLLHASEVRLPNPTSGPELRIRSPLPRDMAKAMEAIRKL